MDNDFFDNIEGDINEQQVFLDHLANFIVPMYQTFIKKGLTPQEAAALAAAMVMHTIPNAGPSPKED